jgi:hypothetical protein
MNQIRINHQHDQQSDQIRPQRWMIYQTRMVIGTGPFRTYKRLMGTQSGIVFRADSGPIIVAIHINPSIIRMMLDQLKKKLNPRDADRLGVIKHESNIQIPKPILAKTHHHKQKRRKSIANQHLDWWKAPVGYFNNLVVNEKAAAVPVHNV